VTVADVTIRRLAPAERDAAARVLGEAFADNPSTLVNARGDRERASRTIRAAANIVKLGNPFAYALVADDNGRIVGVLNATRSPHCQPTPLEKLRAAPRLALALRSTLPRVMTMASARARFDPSEEHWHVGPLGVDPESQGRGVGAALLRAFLEYADRSATPAFLETDVDRNVVFYERFGFRLVGRDDILGIDTRFMRRGVAGAS
jgi:predicted N-acetyltransferase YhbS